MYTGCLRHNMDIAKNHLQSGGSSQLILAVGHSGFMGGVKEGQRHGELCLNIRVRHASTASCCGFALDQTQDIN